MSLTLHSALDMIAASLGKAAEIGVPMVVAVVDAGGNLIAQHRQDDSLLASIDLALNKAYSAVAVRMPTQELGLLAQPGGALYGINTDNGGRLVSFGGGLPVLRDGVLLGGIGVSGGSVEQDVACAEAGLAALAR
ncbi:MAG: heme-binding protein [Desulfovibrio sp.]|jgi:uncharacterized protein GlcG (DUF336 family)|nr:heme-binding protein [Desulfovibrio sp.]